MTQHIRNNTAGSTTWKTFLQAYTDVHDHRRAQGMLVSDIRFNSSSTFSEADSYAAFGEENFVETLGLGKSLKMRILLLHQQQRLSLPSTLLLAQKGEYLQV
jgi:hypothetical protein